MVPDGTHTYSETACTAAAGVGNQGRNSREKRHELFNRERPMVPTKIWKEKRILAEEDEAENNMINSLVDDTVNDHVGVTADGIADDTADGLVDDLSDDPADDSVDDEDTENSDDVLSDMEINMVFALPAEFRVREAEVAELVLGPKNAIFEKPEKPEQHLKPLFIRGHIDGKPIGRMLVDGGAGVNIMPFSVYSKLGRKKVN